MVTEKTTKMSAEERRRLTEESKIRKEKVRQRRIAEMAAQKILGEGVFAMVRVSREMRQGVAA